MKKSLSRRLALFLAGLSVAAGPALAQNGEFAVLNKSIRGVQSGPTTAQPASGNAYGFNASIDGTATTPSGPRTITLPSAGGVRTLSFNANDQQWIFEAPFASLAALDAVFANGTYGFTFGGRTVPVPLTGDLYPAIPVATVSGGTWSNGTLTVERAQPLSITINFSQNYAAGSARLGINVGGGPNSGAPLGADTSNGFNQPQLTLTIPANTLTAGATYEVYLEANRIVNLNTTAAPGYTVASLYSATNSFTLTVAASGPPTFTQQPTNVQIANNSTVVFSAPALGATAYQWRKNNVPIAGATNASLVLFGATGADVGNYSAVATNANGGVTSLPAALSLAAGFDFGRLTNLSILTDLTDTTTNFTLGTVIGGDNTTGTKPLLIRAVGPSLGQPPLNVPGALPDAKFEVLAGATVVAANDDWQGVPAVAEAFTRVGAFPFTGTNSKDAAIFQNLEPRSGGYTVVVSGAPGATGRVIAEFYDATPITTFRATTPRLINVSVRKQIDAGGSLTAGFVIGGSTAKTVLVRAIGPGLAVFGVPGLMADPRLELFNSSSVRIAANDNWGGDPQLTAAGARVGAFALADARGADAMLLLTLVPGNYSAEVRGANGGGTALVEVYEVP
jgi:hypothetical protein